jgi:REP element-mobilizing transposase RayT
MARPLRIEFPGAFYHVTARGNRQAAIYNDDHDYETFLSIVAQIIEHDNWLCYAYCLMPNHYHLVIETPDGNLAKGMRQLNGVYTQTTNRRYGQVGHLFQGRYKAILVDADAHLLEVSRYVVLNPVRAGMVESPEAWPWSSYHTTVGQAKRPAWLSVDNLLSLFAKTRSVARRRYAQFIMDGIGHEGIWHHLNRQIYLGDDRFVNRMQDHLQDVADDINIPQPQRRRPPARSLVEIEGDAKSRNDAILAAYAAGAYSYQDLARHFGLHFTTVGRIVRTGRGK